MLNGISHPYLLDQSFSALRVEGWYSICIQIKSIILLANSGDPDLGLHMSNKAHARLKWVNAAKRSHGCSHAP